MDEKELIYLLRNKKIIMDGIQIARKQILEQLNDKDDLIRQLSLPGSDEGRVRTSKTFKHNDPMVDILESFKKISYENLKLLKDSLNQIAAEEEFINTIFRHLYNLKEPYRSVLILLYCENQKWNYISERLSYSKTKISRIRQEGIDLLLHNYNSKKDEIVKEGAMLLKELISESDNKKSKHRYFENDFQRLSNNKLKKKLG